MDEVTLTNIEYLRKAFLEADRILIGSGAGLSAAAGLSYLDEAVFQKYFPEMYALGYHCQYELVGMKDDEWDTGRKWAYWATHIHYVREIFPSAPLYTELKNLLAGRDFFVVTSNADRQFMRAGFPMDRVFEYQGTYDVMGCSKRCNEHTWDSLPVLHHVLDHIDHQTFRCSDDGIPHCPYCGAEATMGFRPEDHEEGWNRYAGFVNSSVDKKLCIIELGVGFNTPGVIRWPFEKFTRAIPGALLFRVNRGYKDYKNHPGYPQVPEDLHERAFPINLDAGDLIHALSSLN